MPLVLLNTHAHLDVWLGLARGSGSYGWINEIVIWLWGAGATVRSGRLNNVVILLCWRHVQIALSFGNHFGFCSFILVMMV